MQRESDAEAAGRTPAVRALSFPHAELPFSWATQPPGSPPLDLSRLREAMAEWDPEVAALLTGEPPAASPPAKWLQVRGAASRQLHSPHPAKQKCGVRL